MTELDFNQIPDEMDLTRLPADEARAIILQIGRETAASRTPTPSRVSSGPRAAPPIGISDSAIELELLTRHAVFTLELRLLVTTGFLGGLTTFSTFSAEIVTLLMRKEYLWGTITIASHLLGSLALTFAGILLVRAMYSWGAA